MNTLKIKWVVSGDFATANVLGMSFTVKPDLELRECNCHKENYLIESDATVNFSEPLFAEVKAVGIHCAKKRAEEVIIRFVCDELRKANEDE